MHEYFDILQSCLLLDTFKISLGEYRAAPTPRGRDYIDHKRLSKFRDLAGSYVVCSESPDPQAFDGSICLLSVSWIGGDCWNEIFSEW